MGLPTISYLDMATAASGWLAITAGSVFGIVAALFAVVAGLRIFSRVVSFR
jgi:hypothetical protein